MEDVRTLSALVTAIGLALAATQDDVSTLFIGCFFGIMTGLIPGLHFNTLLPFVAGNALIIGIAVSHSFFDFVPAIMLGAPDEASSLSVLPAHKMMLRGRALEAFRLTILGGLYATIAALPLIPLLGFVSKIPLLVPAALLLTLFLMLKQGRKTIPVIAASAILGQAALASNEVPALLAGFFGVSTILFSLYSRPKIPPQFPTANPRVSARQAGLAAISGWFAGLFPAISSSVAAMAVCPNMRHKQFLAVLGGTNTVYAFAAILAIHIVGKAHSGAGLAIAGTPSLLFIAGAALAAAGFSAWLAWELSEKLVTGFNKINYRIASIAALVIIVFLNSQSLLMLSLSTLVGLYCLFAGVRRNTCMASLLIPALLHYLL